MFERINIQYSLDVSACAETSNLPYFSDERLAGRTAQLRRCGCFQGPYMDRHANSLSPQGAYLSAAYMAMKVGTLKHNGSC